MKRNVARKGKQAEMVDYSFNNLLVRRRRK